MNRALLAGIGCSGLGVAGYVLGLVVAYPGRAFSITLVMLGIALIAMRRLDSRPGGDGR